MPRLVLPGLAAALLLACGAPKPRPPPPPPPPDPAAEVAAARDLLARGDPAAARARLEAALLTSPGSDEVKLELADLLASEGQEAARARLLVDGVRAQEGARFFLLSARVAELLGDDLRAEADYGRALALEIEDDTDVRLRRAAALERLGRADEATGELERVRTSRPRDALLRTRIGERYEATGRLAEAESELRVAAEAQPERAQGWERLARFYERAGRTAEARAALERAREASARTGRTLRPLLPSRR